MSEHSPLMNERLEELQPLLSALARNTILAYDALLPVAVPVDEESEDFPVRHSDFELAGRITGKFLSIHFANMHRLKLFNNKKSGSLPYDWQFCRIQPDKERRRTTELTKVKSRSSPPA